MRLTFPTITAPLIVAFCMFFGVNLGLLAQTTNSIPSNVFLNDDGFLFWYKPSGEKVVNIKKIEEAKHLPECQAAEDDPEGHWGVATNGFQLSLRFKKTTFTNEEAIVAIMLIRNVTNNPVNYFRSIYVIASKNGKYLKRKNAAEFMKITVLPMATLFPQTQCRYLENLNKSYDLSENGNYTFQAICPHSAVFSQPVVIAITNGVE